MMIKEIYRVFEAAQQIGTYYVYDNGKTSYDSSELPEGYTKERLKTMLGKMLVDSNRLTDTRKHIWKSGRLRMERIPKDVEKFWVYRRDAKKGEATYSEKSHSAPHFEGRFIEGMEEWANLYCFNKKDDGMFEAELDEAWDGGSHYDGGTIRVEIPEAWFVLSYDEFLKRVLTLAAATHYGFTAEDLKEKDGLKEFFGFCDKS